jgi:hypothetical protein
VDGADERPTGRLTGPPADGVAQPTADRLTGRRSTD